MVLSAMFVETIIRAREIENKRLRVAAEGPPI
jgi:hypothetical protein